MVAEAKKDETPTTSDGDCRSRIGAIVKAIQSREPDTTKVVRKTLNRLSNTGDTEALSYLQRIGMFQVVAQMNYQDRYAQRNAILGRLQCADPADRINPRLAAAKEEAAESLLDMQFGRGTLREATYEEVQSAMAWHGKVASTNAKMAALYGEILSHGEPGQTVGEFISDRLAEQIKRKIYAGASGQCHAETQAGGAAAPASNNGNGKNGHYRPDSHVLLAARCRQPSKNGKH